MNSLIVCEGYQDRAFLSEWLEHVGQPLGLRQVRDAAKQRVRSTGAYVKQVGVRQVTIAPAEGYEQLTGVAAQLARANGERIDRILIVADSDSQAPSARKTALLQSLQSHGVSLPCEVALWEPQLEALMEKALRSFDSNALKSIDAFLASAPQSAKTGKERAFTWCSSWEPDSFGDAFFGLMWKREALRMHLEPLVAGIRPQLDQLLLP
jgi:hypothetical protein